MATEKLTRGIVELVKSLPPMAVTILSLPLSLPLTVWLMGQIVDDDALRMTERLIASLNNPLGVALLYGASALGCASILGGSIWRAVNSLEAHHSATLTLNQHIAEVRRLLELMKDDLDAVRHTISVVRLIRREHHEDRRTEDRDDR
jgi:hypothetical protein